MKFLRILLAFGFSLSLAAQTAASANPDPFQALRFLEGTWDAKVVNNGEVKLSGRYTFSRELDGTIFSRHSTNDPGCTAPASFDCAHGDLLYVYRDDPAVPLKAIYFDNEGHVLHYDVSTAEPASAVFLSEAGHGPRFRLTYRLADGVMKGSFEMQPPGQAAWRTYLEWSGSRH